MTAELELRLDQPLTKSPTSTGAVVTVRQIATGKGVYPKRPFETARLVESGQIGTTIEVPQGRYKLEARLPSGRVLREQATLANGTREVVQFTAGRSAHEWLGWQTISGNVAPAEIYHEQLNNFTARDSDRGFTKAISRGPLVIRAPAGTASDHRLWLPSDFSAGAITDRSGTEPETYFEPGTGISLPAAASGIELALPEPVSIPPLFLSASARMDGLEVKNPIEIAVDHQADPMVSLWTAHFDGETVNWPAPGDAETPPPRPIAIIAGERATLLAFLPTPWIGPDGQPAEIELLHDLSLANDRSLRVSVLDGQRSALLNYLGASRMAEAAIAFDDRNLGERILLEMKAKRRNPLAAAAAAYVGLSIPPGDKRRDRWSPWLANLMNWFPAIPDGAILYARDRFERAKTDVDLKHALDALMGAFLRGPPYFTAGVRHLLDGLSLFAANAERYGADQDTVRAMHAQTADFALLTDPDQTFTVVKLRPGILHV